MSQVQHLDPVDHARQDRPIQPSRRTREMLSAIVEHAPVAIITVDVDGRVQTWNTEAERIFQRAGSEAIGRNLSLLAGRKAAALLRIEQRVLAGERLDNVPVSLRLKDSEPLELEISASPLHSEEGHLSGTVAFVTDVTHRNRTARELKELNADLERRVAERTAELLASNHELEAFCFSVSHDLRAPLRAIDGFSRAVLQDNEEVLSAASRNHLVRVRSASRRMSELIDSLLSLSRLARVEIRRGWVDLSEIAAEVVSDVEASQPERWVEFEVEPGLPAYGDPRLLRLLLENLIGNAFKFTEGVEDAKIRFGQEAGQFFVEDNGAGFDMTYAHRLFQPFERLHAAADYPGHGIGLATAQRIVTRHGGRISADGRVGKGATFRFSLPEGPRDSDLDC